MKYLLVLYILLCSVGFWVVKELRIIQEFYFQLGGLALILGLLFYKLKPIARSRVNIWMGIFGLYSIVLFLFGQPMGFGVMYNIFFGIMVYFITQQLTKEDTGFILKAIIWIGILNILYIAIQHVGMDFIYEIRGPGNTVLYNVVDSVGLLGLKAVVGIWMGLGAVAMFMFNPLMSALFLFPLYLSKCSGAVLGLTLAVVFYLYYTSRRWFKIIVPLVLVGGISYVVFVDSPMGMMNTRPPMWKMAMKDTIYGFDIRNPKVQSPFLRNPLTGFGLDSFRNGPIKYFMKAHSQETIRLILIGNQLFSPTGNSLSSPDGRVTCDGEPLDYWDNPHNEFVQLFFEMGFLGIGIFGFIIYYMVKRFRNAIKTQELLIIASLIILLLGSGVSQFPFHLARIGIIFPILLGLFVVNSEG